mgnify:CR=1 FL=1
MWNRFFVPVACLLASLLLIGGLAGCGGDRTDPSAPSSDAPASEATVAATLPDSVNTLSDAERQTGWTLLFDGQSMDNWRGFQMDAMPDDWIIENGAMHFTGADDEAPDDIITKETYGSFDLRLEWRIAEAGNSGVMFHVREDDFEWPWQTGPEMQVLDNEGHPNGEDPKTSAGANYALHAPAKDATKPVGEWNEARLVVDGTRVTHSLNGTTLVEYTLGSDDWQALVDNTKFADMPGYAQFDTGHIALQDHDDPVWFRDIKIRRLD